MTKFRAAAILMVELAIIAVCGMIFSIATDGGQTCETAYADCGASKLTNASWNLMLLMAVIFVATAITLGVFKLMRIYKKK